MATMEALSAQPADWDAMFPKEVPLPKDGIFELGLVMGGTVSAGAYTAGVIDFLIEALDTWEAQRKANPDDTSIPSWAVQIKAVAGTSGGGVIGAILARALSFKFPPVRKSETSDPNIYMQNPLYRIWVEELDIFSMLDTGDLAKGSNLYSVLNPKSLDLSKGLICNYEAKFSHEFLKRDYVASPLPVFLTLTNLRGIPYSLDMGGELGQSYVDHADYVRLTVFTQGGNSPLHDNEFGVSSNPGKTGFIGWGDVA